MQSVREEPLLEPEFQTKPCRSDTSTPCMIFWESLYTTFPQMKKADVNGENELPLYTWLKARKGFEGFQEHEYKELLEKMFSEADPEWDKKPDIKWNFTKFVIDRDGNVAARFEPTADMAEVEACIKSLL